MKLILNCSDKTPCIPVFAFFSLLLSLHTCALTTFPSFSIGHFYNGKVNAFKTFWGVPCVSNCTDIWLNRGYCKVEAISFGWELGNVQLAEPHVLFVTDAMRVADPTCVRCWHETGQALLCWGWWKLSSETRDAPSSRSAHFSLSWMPMSSVCLSTPFLTASFSWKLRKKQKAW